MPKITSKVPDKKFDRGGRNDFSNREPTLNGKNNGAVKRFAWKVFAEKCYFADVYSRRESDAALECFFEFDRSFPCWIPKTQIDNDSEVWTNNQKGTLVISYWLSEKLNIVEKAFK